MKKTTGNYKLEEKYTKAIISNRTEQKHTYKERDIYIFDKKNTLVCTDVLLIKKPKPLKTMFNTNAGRNFLKHF